MFPDQLQWERLQPHWLTEVESYGQVFGLGDFLAFLTKDKVLSAHGNGVDERLGAFNLTLCASPPELRVVNELLYSLSRLLAVEQVATGVDINHPEVVDAMAF